MADAQQFRPEDRETLRAMLTAAQRGTSLTDQIVNHTSAVTRLVDAATLILLQKSYLRRQHPLAVEMVEPMTYSHDSLKAWKCSFRDAATHHPISLPVAAVTRLSNRRKLVSSNPPKLAKVIQSTPPTTALQCSRK